MIIPASIAAATDFLGSSIDRRLQWLDRLGLLRYAKLLTQMKLSEGNITCVAQFLSDPARIKFPQLIGTDLAGLKLDEMNLIRANLTGANLLGTCLQEADLIFGNFSQANLSGADLQGATLNETIWMQTIVDGCDFRDAIGLTLTEIGDLRSRGGIFNRSKKCQIN